MPEYAAEALTSCRAGTRVVLDTTYEDALVQARLTAERYARPITGWALPALLRLDHHRPGLLAEVTCAQPRRRQVVFGALAMGAMGDPRPYADTLGDGMGWHGADFLALLGEALVTADTRKIVRQAFGSLPDGFPRALERLGSDPLPQAVYARLHAVYGDPSERRRQALLSERPRITEARLDTILALPSCALHPNALRLARSPEDARAISAAVELALERTGATPESIWKSVTDLKPDTTLQTWMTHLLEGFVRAGEQPDVTGLEGATLLDTGEALRAAKRKLRNCLGRPSHLLEVLCGRTAFVLLREGEIDLIVTLRKVGTGWCLTSLLGPDNTIPHEDVLGAAMRRTAAAGFPTLGGEPGGIYEQLWPVVDGFRPDRGGWM